jgi:NTP pyrophosphatase (non-canonical NTP hydrolase)
MDRDYIDTLRQAYEHYFTERHDVPVLVIDTNDLNFVTNPDDFHFISTRIRSYLEEGVFQRKLITDQEPLPENGRLARGQPLADLQRFHEELDKSKGFNVNVYFNYLCLSEEIGELGSELARLWSLENTLISQGQSEEQARQAALREQTQAIEAELADCMAYLLKLANYAGIQLETAYLSKMRLNMDRDWLGHLSTARDL